EEISMSNGAEAADPSWAGVLCGSWVFGNPGRLTPNPIIKPPRRVGRKRPGDPLIPRRSLHPRRVTERSIVLPGCVCSAVEVIVYLAIDSLRQTAQAQEGQREAHRQH